METVKPVISKGEKVRFSSTEGLVTAVQTMPEANRPDLSKISTEYKNSKPKNNHFHRRPAKAEKPVSAFGRTGFKLGAVVKGDEHA